MAVLARRLVSAMVPSTTRVAGLRRYCSEHVTRSVKIGDATFSFSGPPETFDNMDEEKFYENDEFHQFFVDLGLEVFKLGGKEQADAAAEAAAEAEAAKTKAAPASASASASSTPAASSSSPSASGAAAAAGSLPPVHPALIDLELGVDPSMPIWKLKIQVQEKTGVPHSDFDVYNGAVKLEDHKALMSYMSSPGDTTLELTLRKRT
eukprot:Rhum_TRINITY_DN23345_c0_g1::Rhum_TRINITY_DN23345_c0_g1_i1::g.177757::m.177757